MDGTSTDHPLKCVAYLFLSVSNMLDNVRYNKTISYGLYVIPLKTNAFTTPFMCSYRFPNRRANPVTEGGCCLEELVITCWTKCRVIKPSSLSLR